MNVIHSQHLEDHFVEVWDGNFEVKGFVDVTVNSVKVDELSLADTLVDPTITDCL